ncbi:MAG: hypothetical protein JSU08_11480 [Acidobacteria bacterium]|nr:hypothetical protein [Acidobacteriota bacterium]
MATIRPADPRHPHGFAPENREERPSSGASSPAPGTDQVTASRATGVVQPSTSQLTYEVDPAAHRVVARYGDGRIAFAFGEYGHRCGQFDTPIAVVPMHPEFSGEPIVRADAQALLAPWLAVADYGNHRVQYFESDGVWIGESELDPDQPPCHLTWRGPTLDVTTLDGRTIRLHVAAALLATTGRTDDRHERQAHRDPHRVWRVC